jgi:hypothetical protein
MGRWTKPSPPPLGIFGDNYFWIPYGLLVCHVEICLFAIKWLVGEGTTLGQSWEEGVYFGDNI